MGKSAILSVRILGDAKDAMGAFRDTAGAADGFGSKLALAGGVAVAGLAAIGTGAVLAGKALYGVGETFDDMTDTIRIGTGESGEALDELVRTATDVGRAFPTTFGDAGKAVADLNTRLGLTGPVLETVAAQTLEAGRMLGEAIDVNKTSAAFNQFRISGEAVEGAMDDLFRVAQSTGTGMNDLADSVAKGGPALQGLGFGFTESTALIGAFNKAGLNTEGLISAMGKGMVKLAKDGKEPAAAFQEVTAKIFDFTAAGEDAKALDIAAQLFGTKGAAQFVAAVKEGTITSNDLMGAVGATSDTILQLGYETMDASEKWQILKNKGLAALEPLGSAIFDGVGKALGWMTDFIDNTDWSPLTQAIDSVAGAFKNFDQVAQPLLEWAQQFQPAIEGLATAVGDRFTAVMEIINDLVSGVGERLEPLAPQIQDTFDTIGGIVSGAFEIITALWNAGTDALVTAWEIVGEPIINTVSTIFESIMGIIGPALDTIKAVIDTVLAAINGDWDGAWKGIQCIIDGVWRTILGIIDAGINIIKSGIDGMLTIIGNLFTTVWDGIKTTVSDAWESLKTATLKGISDLVQWFKDLPGKIVAALGDLGNLLTNAGKSVINGFVNGLRDAWEAGKEFVGGIGGWIAANKGPISKDRVLLRPAARAIMGGFITDMKAFMPDLERFTTGVTTMLSSITGTGTLKLSAAADRVRRTGGDTYNITFNGVLDADTAADRLRDLLNTHARRRGVIPLSGAVIA